MEWSKNQIRKISVRRKRPKRPGIWAFFLWALTFGQALPREEGKVQGCNFGQSLRPLAKASKGPPGEKSVGHRWMEKAAKAHTS